MSPVLQIFAAACNANKTFFGLPAWYKYLTQYQSTDSLGNCVIKISGINNAYLLILLAVVEMLLRLAAIVSMVFVIIGGVKYIAAQGEPDRLGQARQTVINALIGLVIALVASAVVNFIARKF